MTSLSRTVPLLRTVVLLAALYAGGAAWSAADGLAPLGDALVSGTTINAPLVIVVAQVLGTACALRLRGPRAIAGAALVLLACTLSLAAAALDGDFAHAGLSVAQVAFQSLIAIVTAVAWVLALRFVVPLPPRRTSTAH